MPRVHRRPFACLVSLLLAGCGPRPHGTSDAAGDATGDATSGATSPATSTGWICSPTTGEVDGNTTASPDCAWLPPESWNGEPGSSSISGSSSGGPLLLDLGIPSDLHDPAAQICDAVLACDCPTAPFPDRCACIDAMVTEFAEVKQFAAEHGLHFNEKCINLLARVYPTLNCAQPKGVVVREQLCSVVSGARDLGQTCTVYPGGSDCKPGLECDGVCRRIPWLDGTPCYYPNIGCESGMFCNRSDVCERLPYSGEACSVYDAQFIGCEFCAAGLDCVKCHCTDPVMPNIGDACADGCCSPGLHCTSDNLCAAALKAGQPCTPSYTSSCGHIECGEGLICHEQLGKCAPLGEPGDPCDEFVPCAPGNTCKACVCKPTVPHFCRPDVHLPWL